MKLYTDADADNAADTDDDTRRTKHDCIGSLPNEPKTKMGDHLGLSFCSLAMIGRNIRQI